jgi:molecular chaperone IbpA|tara:strand:+ start:1894 stop:2313 length:420 start_codon:yes stop_codon:yes gene_type:complete
MVFTTHGIGLDSFWDHIQDIEKSLVRNNQSFPPYDIIRHDEDSATIEFAIAGYNRKDITIQVHPKPQNIRVLEISAEPTVTEDDERYEHRGIARRRFRTGIPLSEYWEVGAANFDNGIISIQLTRKVPEEKKTQTIEIS